MRTITKRILSLLTGIMLFAALLPTTAFAIGKIIPSQPVDLTISYMDDTKPISGSQFRIYRVANADEHAFMTLTEDFEKYKNSISGLSDLNNLTQDQWELLASSLKGYVLKDDLAPTAEGKTDDDGIFSVSDLEMGLYLVIGSPVTTNDYYTYTVAPFMLFLPAWDIVENDWDYDVAVTPKYAKDYNPSDDDDYVSRKVLKKWDDDGYESLRPAEVIVQLLKDGKVYDTQTLNKDNNWRYAWDNLDADYEWEVIEKEVEGYAVSITRSGITFTVTNKYVVPIIGTNLPIQKRITGDTPKTNSTFTFVFSAKDVSSPMPEGSNGTVKEITITGAGSGEIGKITFEKPGTYVYTVSEKNGGVEGYTYDSTVYTVTFEVEEKDGELSIIRTIKDNKGNIASVIEFTNPYKTPGNKLPQTGILWWPVPILLCAGLAFVMIGMIRRRRCD